MPIPVTLPTEAEVWQFAQQIPIATRDYGLATITPWGTQRALIRQILAGKAEGRNQFLVLKGRQVGASTTLLLLTLLWMWRYPGLQGLTVTDGQENKEYFRDMFLQLLEPFEEEDDAPCLDEGSQQSQRLRSKNQVQITWANGSRLLLQMAGPRTWSRLGVGRGLAFCHGTECGIWSAGMKALTYLRAAFSDINPAGLYVLESTARGKNWWYDLWEGAEGAQSIGKIFLAWWLREDYRIPRTDKRLWAVYGYPLTPREKEWDHEVAHRYRKILSFEQYAWRRWYVNEKAGGSQRLADQEMPTLPEDAFGASQERPFIDAVTRDRLQVAVAGGGAPMGYVYRWGANLEDTMPEPVAPDQHPVLTVYNPPDGRPVVVAAVPAHSSMEEDSAWVISVWAASTEVDRLEQVAEFWTELDIGLQPFAWACLHLAGAYGASHKSFILEIAGLGQGVLSEIRRLVSTGWGTSQRPQFGNFLGSIRHYIWRRPDSILTMGALQWKSHSENQGAVLQRLRDQIIRGVVLIRSPELAEELSRLEAEGDTYAPTGEIPRGHRAMAAALAVESWVAQLYPMLRKYRRSARPGADVQQRALQSFFMSLNRR